MHRSRLHLFAKVVWNSLFVVCAVAWIVGRVFSDRYTWSQPVSWIPTPFLLMPVWVRCATVFWRAHMQQRITRQHSSVRPVRALAPVLIRLALGLFVLLSGAQLFFFELGLERSVGRVLVGEQSRQRPLPANNPATPTRSAAFTLLFWNQAGNAAGDIAATFLAKKPDIFVLANRHSRTKTRDIAQAFIDTGEAHAAVGWPFDLFSRLPIERWASTSLNLAGKSRKSDGTVHTDPGWAAWYQLRARDGSALTIWAIDLPSSPTSSRWVLVQDAATTITTWIGSVRVVDKANAYHTMPSTAFGPAGFPKPDIIVGDFNIPRHSASLRAFLRACDLEQMRNSFDIAGVGWQRTWPRTYPIWAIDQCFVSPTISVRTSATFDPGIGTHRALIVESKNSMSAAQQ